MLVTGPYPFKFNRAWLLEEGFTNWVGEVWSSLPSSSSQDSMHSLAHKIRVLKGKANVWMKEKSMMHTQESLEVHSRIKDLLEAHPTGILSLGNQTILRSL